MFQLQNVNFVRQIYAPNKKGEPPQFCTVFNHMVKSGGTSIKQQMIQSSEREADAEPGKRSANHIVFMNCAAAVRVERFRLAFSHIWTRCDETCGISRNSLVLATVLLDTFSLLSSEGGRLRENILACVGTLEIAVSKPKNVIVQTQRDPKKKKKRNDRNGTSNPRFVGWLGWPRVSIVVTYVFVCWVGLGL